MDLHKIFDDVDAALARQRPLMFMDIDGVLCPWNAQVPVEHLALDGPRIMDNGYAGTSSLTVPVGTVDRLRLLAETFDMVWATWWRGDAVTVMAPMLGVGHDWPVLEFDESKWLGMVTHSMDRPFVWIDDEVHIEQIYYGIRPDDRPSALVLRANYRHGLTDELVARALAFAEGIKAGA